MSALPTAPSAPPAVPARKAAVPARMPQLRRGDYEFLPAALEILETPLSPVRSSMMLTIGAFVVAALVWSYLGRVDIIASAQGKIQPIGRTKTVQPLDTGKVLKVAVENGTAVKAGDLLVELDPSEAKADEATLHSDIVSRGAEVERRTLALDAAVRRASAPPASIAWPADTPPDVAAREARVLTGDLAQLSSAVASLDAQRNQKFAEGERLKATIAAQQVLVATLKQRVDMRTELFSRNAESKASVIDSQEVYQTQQTNLASQRGQFGEAQAGLLLAQRDIEKTYAAFIADNAQKLADAERMIEDDRQKLVKAQVKTSHMRLVSPIEGIVQGLTVTTVGQVVSSGEQIMQVVPAGSALEIECYLPNGDSGFVKPGQSAIVKIESFPFTDYGTIDAHVVRVARDAIPQVEAEQREENPVQSQKATMFGGAQRTQNLVFPVTLTLDKSSVKVDGADVALTPGMAVTVEVKTGTRRILNYLFAPLVETLSTAMRER